MKLVLGSRGSDLALAQSRNMAERLRALPAPPEVEIKIIKTSGDRIQDVPLAAIGATNDERKGFFTKEIEDALLSGDIDLAVHSYKDLPTQDVPGLVIAAIPERVGVRDVLIFPQSRRTSDEPPFVAPGSAIGTASMRRIAQVQQLWPTLRCVAIRGNVPTRLHKARAGRTQALNTPQGDEVEIAGIILAEAGLNRLRAQGLFEAGGAYAGLLDGMCIEPIATATMPTAPAQGALAMQCRADDATTRGFLEALHDSAAEQTVRVEREILAALEGGCHLPLGASCRRDASSGQYYVRVFLGAEAPDNRSGTSHCYERGGTQAAELAAAVVAEVQSSLPIVLVGRAGRVKSLERESERVQGLGLIDVQATVVDEKTRQALMRMIMQSQSADSARKSEPLIVAAFSQAAVEHFRLLLDQMTAVRPDFQPRPETWRWAVTGERTAQAIDSFFPGAEVAYQSADGTSGTLAADLPAGSAVIGLAATYGRPEFFETVGASGADCLRLVLYETVARPLNSGEVQKLPDACYVVFGSPSAARAFLDTPELPAAQERAGARHLYCALGKTTAAFIRERGLGVYAVAEVPDYESMVQELL